MNNDLISRIAVRDMLHDEMEAWGNCADEIEALLKANDALWEIPAVDAVEVVRCKDCIHYDTYFRKCYLFCTHEYHTELEVEDDHFCSHGERREDG